jgi:hypothetical protein
MNDIKMVIRVKHYPSESPGPWDDSTLKLYLKGNRHLIIRIQRAIREELAKEKP